MIAFYYGFTGFACAWYYRKDLTRAPATSGCKAPAGGRRLDALLHPGLEPLLLLEAGEQLHHLVDAVPPHWTSWCLPDRRRAVLIGIVLMFIYASLRPPFFRGEVLTRSTPTLVPETLERVGLFGVDPDE